MHNRFAIYLAVLVTSLSSITLSASAQDAPRSELRSEEVFKQSLPSVMTLRVTTKDGHERFGSGFLAIKDGIAITAWHVVRDAKSVTARFADREEFDVSGLIDKDEKRDTALIRIKVAGRPLLRLSSADPEVGVKALVIGAPQGLEFSLSDGIISQIRTEGSKIYQFTCPASPGNSGGPLLGGNGLVLGVVSFQIKDGQNLNFAAPAAYALGLDASLPTQPWEQVKSTLTVPGTGGLEQIDKVLGRALLAINDAGALLGLVANDVMQKSGGFKKGVPVSLYLLQKELAVAIGELERLAITDAGRKRLQDHYLEWMKAYLNSFEPLAQSIIVAQQAGGWVPQAQDLSRRAYAAGSVGQAYPADEEATLRKSSQVFESIVGPILRPLGSSAFGFRLGVYRWAKQPSQIIAVRKGGLADRLGFKGGDIVVKVGGDELKHMSDLMTAISAASNKKLIVAIIRDNKERTLTLAVPKNLEKYK